MAFNADAHVAALTPPEFNARRRRFVGRVLSTAEWLRLHGERVQLADTVKAAQAAVAAGTLTTDAGAAQLRRRADAVTRGFIAAWFPAPWYWRPLAALTHGRLNPAWRAFRRLPEATQLAAIADFSACQRNAMPSRPSATSGEAGGAPPAALAPTT